jgi:hypothetical protein
MPNVSNGTPHAATKDACQRPVLDLLGLVTGPLTTITIPHGWSGLWWRNEVHMEKERRKGNVLACGS